MAVVIALLLSACHSLNPGRKQGKIVYQSPSLIITQLTENTFQHTTFLQTQSFGNVPCNGMIVRGDGEAIVFDTTPDSTSSVALINWISGQLKCEVKAVVITHFHIDNLGGLAAFTSAQIPSYAQNKTIALAKAEALELPNNGFDSTLKLYAGSQLVEAKFFGEGHTSDNVVGYFPSEKVLFGGCLIKELNANKGNLADANESAWSNTVRSIKVNYPEVIPNIII